MEEIQGELMIAHPPCNHLAVSGARWFGTWTVTKKATKAKYEHLDICIIQECAP